MRKKVRVKPIIDPSGELREEIEKIRKKKRQAV